jgi:hypothetical protein
MAKRLQGLVHGAGHHHAERHDLVERGIGGVAAALKGKASKKTSPVVSRARPRG